MKEKGEDRAFQRKMRKEYPGVKVMNPSEFRELWNETWKAYQEDRERRGFDRMSPRGHFL